MKQCQFVHSNGGRCGKKIINPDPAGIDVKIENWHAWLRVDICDDHLRLLDESGSIRK